MKKLLFCCLLLVVLLAGGAFWFGNPGIQPESTEPSKFQTLPIRFGVLRETVSGTGFVQPRESVVVCAEVSGRVVEMLKDYGDKVKEGDPLLILDDTDARLKLVRATAAQKTAEAALKAAEADVEKASSVAEAAQTELADAQRADFPQSQLRVAEAKVKAARAAVTAADAMVGVARERVAEAEAAVRHADWAMGLATIRVPYVDRPDKDSPRGPSSVIGRVLPEPESGRTPREFTILERKVALNQLVGPPTNSHVFTLAGGPEMVEVHAQISEGDISRVAIGQEVVFTVSAYPDDTFEGRVIEVRPVPLNLQGAVFYTVIVAAKNRRDPLVKEAFCLRPGMPTSSLDIVYARHEGADGKGLWLVPNAALGMQLEEAYQMPGSKELAKPTADLQVIWVQVNSHLARPLRVKVGPPGRYLEAGKNQDTAYSVIEAWDPASEKPSQEDALADPSSAPQLVINAEPTKKSRWSNLGNVLRLQ